MDGIVEAQYLWEQRADGRYVPKVSVQIPRHDRTEALIITDPEGRTYRDLNNVLAMDFWLLNRWRRQHAPKLELAVKPV